MTPIIYFENAWQRCDELRTVHVYLAGTVTGALSTDELLRSEWVARVSALDLFVHELVEQKMMAIFEGRRPTCPGYSRFSCKTETLHRVHNAKNLTEASAAFNLEIRTTLGRITFQMPNDIADGVRMVSSCELWKEIAMRRGVTGAAVETLASSLKKDLSLIVLRRNKIAHEGDLLPTVPRTPWSITRADVDVAAALIRGIVDDIDAIV